jgi:hypothetical protein
MIADEVDLESEALQQLPVSKLHERFVSVYSEAPRSRNRVWLIRKILWRLQSLKSGSLSERARQRATELAKDADVRLMPAKRPLAMNVKPSEKKSQSPQAPVADERLPSTNTPIFREYKGQHIEVRVISDGFEYEGKKYKSLSAVAKFITGSHCNGYRFFRLDTR